ncbi:MAG: hypothetical protein M3178_02845 [Pseudomonadota bacterium]|nr:hypothetical protein [Pseudomonadota bacterium]
MRNLVLEFFVGVLDGLGATFDAVLVTFDTNGVAMFSPALSQAACTRLGDGRLRIDRPLTVKHRQYLAWHAARVFAGQPISSR